MTSMLHALSSTFTTCACGARARDCALTRLAEFVHAGTPPTPSPSPPSSFSFDSHLHRLHHSNSRSHEAYGEENGQEKKEGKRGKTSLGPLIGAKRGFRTRERVPGSGGMSGVEMDVDVDSTGALSLGKVKWTGEAGPSSSSRVNGIGVSGSGVSGSGNGMSGMGGMSGSGMERSVSGSTEGSVVSGSNSSRKGKGRASVGEEEQDVEMDLGRGTRGALSLSPSRRRYLTFTQEAQRRSQRSLSLRLRSLRCPLHVRRPNPTLSCIRIMDVWERRGYRPSCGRSGYIGTRRC